VSVIYQQTARSEWQVLVDDKPIGFVFRGRRINPRQHLWYAFDLRYEAVGVEHFLRRDATATLLIHHHNMRGSKTHDTSS
jgi:hypothetical protein